MKLFIFGKTNKIDKLSQTNPKKEGEDPN
jgi:hypothetical protein